MAESLVIEGKGTNDVLGTGRRKTSVARVRLRSGGKGRVAVNGRALDDYFPVLQHRNAVLAPLALSGRQNEFDVVIRVEGGGPTGQADACKLGIARALKQVVSEIESQLRGAGMLTRDARMKERKKYGLRGARRATQFSKR